MAGKSPDKVIINSEWMKWVFDHAPYNPYSLGKLEDFPWSERAIRLALEKGKMTKEMFDAIAKKIDVDSEYLEGKYLWTLDLPEMRIDGVEDYWKENFLHPKFYPHLRDDQRKLGVRRHFLNTLIMHGISEKEYLELSKDKRDKLWEQLDNAVTEVLAFWFPWCEKMEMVDYHQSMEWMDERDVYDALGDYLIERDIWPAPDWDDEDDSPNPIDEKYKNIPIVNA